MKIMKLCKDCKHYRSTVWCYSGIEANYPSGSESSVPDGCMANMKINPVTGRKVYQSAGSVRTNITKCGPLGKWFEPD